MPLATLLLAAHLIAQAPAPPASPPPAARAEYEAARGRAGRDAPSQVKLALWCEAHGLPAERLRHLAQAALLDPGNAAARGLMGVVRFGDAWARPEKVAAQVEANADLQAKMADYHERRDRAVMTADGQGALARWCEENGLADEARAHHAVALRFDPDREVSRRRLGYNKDGKRWVTDEQLAAEREEARRQAEANRRWKAALSEWRGWLDERGERRAKAEAGLASVGDPRAVPAILQVFGRGGAKHRDAAIRLLGQVDSAASSRALAVLAVTSETAGQRRAATEVLRRRDPREFADVLIGMLREPIRYTVLPPDSPGSPGSIRIEGRQRNVVRDYRLPEAFQPQAGDRLKVGPDGRPILQRSIASVPIATGWDSAWDWLTFAHPGMPHLTGPSFGGSSPHNKIRMISATPLGVDRYMEALAADTTGTVASLTPVQFNGGPNFSPEAKASMFRPDQYGLGWTPISKLSFGGSLDREASIPVGRAMEEAADQLARDRDWLEDTNREISSANDSVIPVLSSIAGRNLGSEPANWQRWYVDQLGYSSLSLVGATVPTETVMVTQLPLMDIPMADVINGEFRRISCFGAGTLVQSLSGPVSIEKLRVGDRVLTSSERSGALAYHPVTVVHHNPPSPTFLVKVSGDTIVSSPFHRFWVRGRGWVMARDLSGGEELRLLGGTARVESVEPGPAQPVFNLDVAGDHDFFAGGAAALVHDNSLPDTRLVPFDSVAKAPTP